MNEKLAEIDAKLRFIESFDLDNWRKDELTEMDAEERQAIIEADSSAKKELPPLYEQLGELSPSLTEGDVIEAYRESGKTLRGWLAYYIYEHFNENYIPTVKYAVEQDHQSAHRLFAKLPPDSDENIAIIEQALNSQWYMNVDTALAFVKVAKLIQLREQVERLLHHQLPSVASYAREVLEELDP